ncbi:hypothetical protein [Ancylomarina longa]|uniref:Uncharacterized protein n=1 Tax=Ancylomarina longa TaxID=2487017 RepID=A0A434AZK1_9BACT|nr:hypothetical protein [Ancylomarina longa]RUT79935.1 hypothetical protein DLK05_00855 [Ancylomarina longa]
MEWTELRIEMADCELKRFHKEKGNPITLNPGRGVQKEKYSLISTEDIKFVGEKLIKLNLIENSPLITNKNIYIITDFGKEIVRDYDHFSKFLAKQERKKKKANRQRLWEVFIKYVRDFNEIGKAIILIAPAVLFVLSIFFSEEITSAKNQIQEFIKPDTPTQQTTTTDTIQNPIIKGH